MPLSKRLFRESALERLSSPEQLDQQLQVTSPRGWVALLAIWALLAAVIVWSLLGSVPTKEEGRGILVVGGGLREVVSPGTGRLSSILVDVKQEITEGQLVAIIDQYDILDELNETRSQLEEQRRQHEKLEEQDRREEEAQAKLEIVERERLEQTISYSNERLDRLTTQESIVAGLVEDGMMTEIDLFKIKEAIEETELAREQARNDIEALAAKNEAATNERSRRSLERQLKLEELQGKVSMLEAKFKRESEVVSGFAGRVVEVRAAEQTTVSRGDSILLIEPPYAETGELEAILYVSAATGKRVHEGMPVQVSPSTVKREEYGSMLGTVSFVAGVPTSKSAMLRDLSDKDLVETLAEQIGLPLQLRVSLDSDPDTASGYRWTSSVGPPVKVSAGTLCTGLVTVEEQRPIELLLPMIKKKLGIE